MQLIIPAYNEEARLPGTLRALRAYAMSSGLVPGPPLEVLVVDNASTDRTTAVALAFDSPTMRVRVLPCPVRGKGAAVRAGVAATTADVVGFMDADCATALEAFGEAARLLAAGADMAIGSRAVEGAVTTERHSRLRGVGAWCYRRLTAALVPDVSDTQCGFKIMRGELARTIFSDTTTAGFSFDVEVLLRAHLLGASVVEFPVTWVDVPGSTFSPARHGLRSFVELAGISLRVHGMRAALAGRATVRPLHVPPAHVDPVSAPLAAEA